MTAIGVGGWIVLTRGYAVAGLAMLAASALLGVDSLGHYWLAPISAHSLAMNSTILLEVSAAAAVLMAVAYHVARRVRGQATS